MAEFTGTVQLQKSVAELLAASDDPALIASLLPGCEALHRIDAEQHGEVACRHATLFRHGVRARCRVVHCQDRRGVHASSAAS